MLDLGCGTGVLAMAAARVLPGARVLAVDNDPLATGIARTNARLNGVGRRVRVIDAAGFGHPLLRPAGAFDLVLANLLPGPLIALAPVMRRALRPGGVAVLSGLLDHQAREVAATYRAANFRLAARSRRAGWTVLTVMRMSRERPPSRLRSGDIRLTQPTRYAFTGWWRGSCASARMSWSEAPYMTPFMLVSMP